MFLIYGNIIIMNLLIATAVNSNEAAPHAKAILEQKRVEELCGMPNIEGIFSKVFCCWKGKDEKKRIFPRKFSKAFVDYKPEDNDDSIKGFNFTPYKWFKKFWSMQKKKDVRANSRFETKDSTLEDTERGESSCLVNEEVQEKKKILYKIKPRLVEHTLKALKYKQESYRKLSEIVLGVNTENKIALQQFIRSKKGPFRM